MSEKLDYHQIAQRTRTNAINVVFGEIHLSMHFLKKMVTDGVISNDTYKLITASANSILENAGVSSFEPTSSNYHILKHVSSELKRTIGEINPEWLNEIDPWQIPIKKNREIS